MIYNIVKLNRQTDTPTDFQYLIEFPRSSEYKSTNAGVLAFDAARRWFNSTYSWSQDIETRAAMHANKTAINSVWAYHHSDGNKFGIYVDSDQTLNWFVLSHKRD